MASKTLILITDPETGLAEHTFPGDYGEVAVVSILAGVSANITVNGDDVVPSSMEPIEQYGVLAGGRRIIKRGDNSGEPTIVKVRTANPSTGQPALGIVELEVGTPGELSRYEVIGEPITLGG